jgi:tetratricopeptide (TPR) repeat protein
MSRFSNLEFSANEEHRPAEQEALKDETYYLAEAQTFLELGEFERALRSYSKVLEFNPQRAAAWTGQVRMLIELGEFKEAKLWADKALERFPQESELLAAKAVALGRMGDSEAALAFSDASFEERGDSPYLWLARADVFMARKEKQAEFCLQKALATAANNWMFHWLAARLYYVYRKFASSLKVAQQALALDAGQSVVWLQIGLCQQALGMSQFRESYERALELNPDNRAVRALLDGAAAPGAMTRFRGWLQRKFSS